MMAPKYRHLIFTCLAVIAGSLFFAGISDGDVIKKGVHKNKAKLPAGCGSCHKGHGKKGTVMLPLSDAESCMSCHGSKTKQNEMTKNKKMSQGMFMKDLEDDFRKAYRHPIEVTGIHVSGESLPESDPNARRHATCADCHHPHKLTKENPLEGTEGAKKKIKIVDNATEYEVCYKCHSSSANLPPGQKNKEEEFDPRNRSYHPVEQMGRNLRVPSLMPPLNTTSTITCSDCHSGDGYNAARGPHGSSYEHILKFRYEKAVRGPESPTNYELCYSCHRRESLLANASWDQHARHINITSCKTCHNSHGSRNKPYLIDFNPYAVYPNREGRIDFMEYGDGKFDCFLKCHDADHTRDGVIPYRSAAVPAATGGRK